MVNLSEPIYSSRLEYVVPSPVKSATFIAKVISSCNLACKYCDADIYSNQHMSYELLQVFIKKALDEFEVVNFIWHGGEPLSLGIKFYQDVVDIENEFTKKGQIIHNGLQTNGTLLNLEWLDFFAKNNFGFGISLDGPVDLHNKNRVFKNEKGSYEKVMSAIDLMQKRGKQPGVISVITEETLKLDPKEFLDFFISNNINSVSLNWERPRFNKNDDISLERGKYSEFVKALFDLWYEDYHKEFDIREFKSIMNALLGGKNSFCILEGKCIGKYFGVSPIGDVYHCDEFMFDEDYKLGNVTKQSFGDMLNSEKLIRLRSKNQDQINNLKCDWIRICNGGCPKDRYVIEKYRYKNSNSCCGWSDIIEHIAKRLEVDIRLNEKGR